MASYENNTLTLTEEEFCIMIAALGRATPNMLERQSGNWGIPLPDRQRWDALTIYNHCLALLETSRNSGQIAIRSTLHPQEFMVLAMALACCPIDAIQDGLHSGVYNHGFLSVDNVDQKTCDLYDYISQLIGVRP